VYIPDYPGDAASLDDLAGQVGTTPRIVMWFKHWAGPYGAFDAADFIAVNARNATPMITWMSDKPAVPGDSSLSSQAAYAPRIIAAGAYDAYIRGWADGLRALGMPVLLRLDHEMNGIWYAWSPGVNGNTAADYINMWRHVHDVFRSEGATNVGFVWSPNVTCAGCAAIRQLYPGDSYVDWVGLDGFNWGSTKPSGWQSFEGLFAGSLRQVRAITSRPVMIAETASAAAGGDKAAWITNMFSYVVNHEEISALVWFDENKETDWRFNSSDAAFQAFASGLPHLR
jgi:beta-mannanase